MSFFRGSFANLGEALKTISLAIAVLGALLSAVGYVYGTLSSQKAIAAGFATIDQRVTKIEEDRKNVELWRFRIEQTEKGVQAANEKLDRLEQTMGDIRIVVEGLAKRP